MKRAYAEHCERGVLARLEVDADEVRLVLDDAGGAGPNWVKDEIVTVLKFDPEAFLSTALTSQQYEDIGLLIVARLAALQSDAPPHGKTRPS
jgi:hypothetical protein